MNEEELYKFFGECGVVKGVRVIRNKVSDVYTTLICSLRQQTTIGLGIAYVLFDKRDQAQLALGLTGQKLRHRVCAVTTSIHIH